MYVEQSETSPLLSDHDREHEQTRNDGSLETTNWWNECRTVSKSSTPLIFTYLLQYFFQLAVVLAASRLSTDELAAVSIGTVTSNIIGYSIFEGLTTGLDTLCAQAYGAGHHDLVGLHTARFSIFILLVAVPICATWLFSPQILAPFVPSEQLAQDAGTFLRWSVIGVPGYCLFEAWKRFMQAQKNFSAGLIVLLICLPLNLFLNWFLVLHLSLGIPGAALAASLTNLIRPFLLAGYVGLFASSALQCLPKSLSWQQLFSNWRPMVALSLPGAIMTLSEWFTFELLQFSTSYLGNTTLAAQTFVGTCAMGWWNVPFAVSVVCGTRIGTTIGAGHISAARRMTLYHANFFVVVGLANMALTAGSVELSARYLTADPVVQNATRAALPYAVMFVFCDALVTGAHGAIRGLGWQAFAGVVVIGVNYLYAVPLAFYLELGPPGMEIRGLWLALGSGLLIQAAAEALILMWRPWKRVEQELDERAE